MTDPRRQVPRSVLLPAAVIGFVAASVAIDVWWLHHFRQGFPVNIDEANYMGFGLALQHAFAHGGLRGAWHVWEAQMQFGPLLPLASVPVFAVLGDGVVQGLVAQLFFLGLLLLASYGLGARLTSRTGGLVLVVIVAGTPSIIDFSRTFEFATTAAGVLTACTCALLASDGLRRRRWVVVWGVSLGLLPLARTMAIAFVPAQLVAAAWLLLVRPGARRSRLVNCAGGLGVGAIVAVSWLGKSWNAQWKYLTKFGYGGQSAHF